LPLPFFGNTPIALSGFGIADMVGGRNLHPATEAGDETSR